MTAKSAQISQTAQTNRTHYVNEWIHVSAEMLKQFSYSWFLTTAN